MRFLARRLTRAAAILTSAVAFATCSESPTGPSRPDTAPGLTARVAFAPSFSASAQQAAGMLQQAGVAVTTVRIVIRRPGTDEVLLQRDIPVDPGQKSVTLEADVTIRGAEEALAATFQFRDASGTVLFEGTASVTARPGNTTPSAIPVAVIEFVGPGARATQLRVTPADTTISTRGTAALSVTALDAAGATIPNPILVWTVDDATLGAVSAAGVVTPSGKRGALRVRVATPNGIFGEATVRMLPPPSRIVVVGGDGQIGGAGATLPQPFTVEVQAADGLPAQGETVTFSAVTAGGSVTTATAVTDAQGRASTTMRLGQRADRYEFRAVSGSVGAVTIAATATAAPASRIAVASGDGQSGTVGSALASALAVRVTDAFDNPVAGATVAWARTSGSGSLAGTTSSTGTDGIARMTYTLGTSPGTETVSAALAAVPGTAVTFTMTSRAGAPRNINVVSGNGQSGAASSTLPLPLVVNVSDAFGNASAGEAVAWGVSSGNATLAATSTAASASGAAQNVVTLGNPAALPATVTITASIASGASVSFTATITAPLVAKLMMAQQPPSMAASGVPLPSAPQVQVANAAGQPVAQAGIPVTVSVFSAAIDPAPAADAMAASAAMPPSLAVTGQTTVTTDAAGRAAFPNLTITGSEGPVVLVFTAPSLQSATSNAITLTAGPVASLALKPAAPTSPIVVTAGSPITQQLWVETYDASGNRAPNAAVRVLVQAGGATGPVVKDTTVTTNVIGEFSAASLPVPTVAGTYTITMSVNQTSTPVSFVVTVQAATTTGSVLPVGSSLIRVDSGTVVGPRSVVVKDANGVAMPNVPVTFTLPGSGANGSFASGGYTLSATTNASGVAAMASNWLLPPTTPSSFTMEVTAGTATAPVGSKLTFVATQTQWRYAISATPSSPAAASQVTLTAQLVDGYQSAVAEAGRSVSWATTSGGTFAASPTTTDASGIATATFTTTASAGAAHAITASDNFGVAGSTTVSNALPTSAALTKISGDLASDTVGARLAQPIVVRLMAGGVPVPNALIEWESRDNVNLGDGYTDHNAYIEIDSVTWSSYHTTTTDSLGYAKVYVVAGTYSLGTDTTGIVEARSSSTGTFSSVAFTIFVRPGEPDEILNETSIQGDQRVGVTFTEAPSVRIVDYWWNPVKRAGVPVTVTPYYLSGIGSLSAGVRDAADAPARQRGNRVPWSRAARTRGPALSLAGMPPVPLDTLFGVTTVSTDANGIAAFPGLKLHGRAGNYELTFTSGTLYDDWQYVTIDPGVASRWKLAVVGNNLTPAPNSLVQLTAQLADAWNNSISNDTVQRTLYWSAADPGTFDSLTGPATKTTTSTYGFSSADFWVGAAGKTHVVSVMSGTLGGSSPTLTVTAPNALVGAAESSAAAVAERGPAPVAAPRAIERRGLKRGR